MSNLSEIKNEYTSMLIRILKPLLYEGLQSNYNTSIDKFNKISKYKNTSVLQIFQKTLIDIPLLNNELLETETNRIRSYTKCAEYFDNLVRAVLKSHIVLLSNKNITLEIKIPDFIHKCYVECGKSFYTCPQLFYDKLECYELIRNKNKAYDIIGDSIKTAIHRMLPMNEILKNYLDNDNISEDTITSEHNSFGICNLPGEINIENVLLNTEDDK